MTDNTIEFKDSNDPTAAKEVMRLSLHQSHKLESQGDKQLVRRLWGVTPSYESDIIKEKGGSSLAEWFNAADYVLEKPDAPIGISPVEGRDIVAFIRFQDGPIKERGINGVQTEDLIELARQRLHNLAYMGGRDPDTYTTNALMHLKLALESLIERKVARTAANVEGTSQQLSGSEEPLEPLDGGGYEDTESTDGTLGGESYEDKVVTMVSVGEENREPTQEELLNFKRLV